MKNSILSICIIVLGLQLAFGQIYTTGTVNLSTTSGLAMTAKIDIGTQVNLTLTGPAGRWFALGFNASSMTNGTDVVGVHSAGTLSAFDCKLIGFSAPVTDPMQNWTINTDVVSGGVRTITASRPLNTGDANDFVFPSAPSSMSLIWARSGSSTFSYSNHGGSNRGIVTVGFTQVFPPAAPTGAANQTFCAGATLAQIVASGTSIQWYATPTGGQPLPANTPLIGGSTYYATQTQNGLESTNRLAVSITLNTVPSTPSTIAGALDFCYSSSSQVYSIANVVGATSYVWTLPNGASGTSTSPSIDLQFNQSFQSGSLSVVAINSCGQSGPSTILINQHVASNTVLNITTCNAYTFNGQNYTQSGTYDFQANTVWGCDSVVTLNLTISPVIETNFSDNACGSYPWNGQTYFTSGVYTDTLQSTAGCDSIVTLNLNVYPIEAILIDSTVLDLFVWNGTQYTASGTYTQNFTSVHGCDSTVTINLIIEDSGLLVIDKKYSISPNPVKKTEMIFIKGLFQKVDYSIVNLLGEKIQEGFTTGQIILNNSIQKGSYLIVIEGKSYQISIID